MSANHRSGRDHTVIDIGKKSKKCIFRVPNVLRRQKPEAYTPDVVSIGPFHHYPEKRGKKEGKGEEDFQLMKQVKQSYLNEILACMENITLEELTAKVAELSDKNKEGGFEERARSFYAEKIDHISSTDFIEMMIVDGCFLVQLFRKCYDANLRVFDDPVFNMDCMFHYLCHDILLLENQLPWFVIHSLYGLIIEIYPDEASLSVLILEAFSMLPSLKQICSSYNKHLRRNKCFCDADYLHILDLVRASIVIPLRPIEERCRVAGGESEDHQVHSRTHQANFDLYPYRMRAATALSGAEIKFQSRVAGGPILDIRFKKGGWFSNGILKIPQLDVGMSSETLFRNLIAIEQCYHGYSKEITSYVILMHDLISSREDMELLCKAGIIDNWMSDEDGRNFFQNLYEDIPRRNTFYYADLCTQVNERYMLRRYRLERCIKNYCSNPGKLLYVFVCIILLQVLPTILQTTFAIKEYYYPQK